MQRLSVCLSAYTRLQPVRRSEQRRELVLYESDNVLSSLNTRRLDEAVDVDD